MNVIRRKCRVKPLLTEPLQKDLSLFRNTHASSYPHVSLYLARNSLKCSLPVPHISLYGSRNER